MVDSVNHSFAVIFDFDGLILDTEAAVFGAWRDTYARAGARISTERWGALIGSSDFQFDPFEDIAQQTGAGPDRAALGAFQRARQAELVAALPVLPGVEDRLDEARELGWKVAVASSSSRPWVAGHLERLGLMDRVHAVRTKEDVARTKPDPALFLRALEALGVPAHRAVVFEDSPHGLNAARAAGIHAVAVPNTLTAPLDLSAADRRVSSLAEITLREIGAHLARANGAPRGNNAAPRGV